MRLLLVEDDEMVGEGVQKRLRKDGFTVDWVTDGRAAQAAMSPEFDMVLLDLALPRMDGLELLKMLRGRGDRTPVLILTARDAVADRVKGLDAGADDYLVKPFQYPELVARIRALLRREAGRAAAVLQVGRVSLDFSARSASLDGAPVTLSAREFSVLAALLARPGLVLTRAQLEEKVYGWGATTVGSNAIEVHIHALRRKLGSGFIKNVRGVGYMVPRPTA